MVTFSHGGQNGAEITESEKNRDNHLRELKRYLVFKEYRDMDEKDYIPLDDFLFMLENNDTKYRPSRFIDLSKKYPTSFMKYINDKRPISINAEDDEDDEDYEDYEEEYYGDNVEFDDDEELPEIIYDESNHVTRITHHLQNYEDTL